MLRPVVWPLRSETAGIPTGLAGSFELLLRPAAMLTPDFLFSLANPAALLGWVMSRVLP